jgi:hypothetical protein
MKSISRQLQLVALTSALVLLASAQLADAGILRAALSQAQAPAVTEVPPGPAAPGPAMPSPMMVDPSYAAAAGGICCPQACISYRHLGRVCQSLCCQPSVETVLSVKAPCSCCPVCVPVCLPACCLTCEPAVSCRHGLFAQGIVTYDYACGVSVTVRFKHHGEIIVTYRGV